MQIRPDLQEINQLCGNNMAFRKRLISVLKNELPKEAAVYRKNLASGNFSECSENVHKLKHKISILGLDEAYHLALSYEEDLKDSDTSKSEIFDKILNQMIYFTREL